MLFPHRRTRKRTEEDLSEMGEFSFGPRRVPYRRPVRGHEGRQDAHQAARGALWGETGEWNILLQL